MATEVVSISSTPEQRAAEAEARLQALLSQDTTQANAVTALVGDTGTGKTRLVCTGIEYCWEVFHRISRVYTADLGGFGDKLLSLIKMKIAQVYNPLTHIEAFETVEACSHGRWPERLSNDETGLADPHVRLMPPRYKRWTVYCLRGHLVKQVVDARQLNSFQVQCPECKEITTPHNWSKVDEQTLMSPGFRHVGLFCFDSGTALQEHVMNDMADRAGRDELGGEKGAINKIVSGQLVMGSNNRAHYGFAQNRAYQWIKNSRAIPGQVVPSIWTFLEERTTDEGKGVVVFSPKIAGQAKGPTVPSWVGNCLNTVIEKDDRNQSVHRLYLETHMNAAEGNVPHLAKTRADPGTLPAYLEDPPGQHFTMFSLAYFFRQLDSALEVSIRRDAEKYPDAPVFQPFADDTAEEILEEKTLGQGQTPAAAAGMVSRSRARPTPGRPPVAVSPVVLAVMAETIAATAEIIAAAKPRSRPAPGRPSSAVGPSPAVVTAEGPAPAPAGTAPVPAQPLPAPPAPPASSTAVPAASRPTPTGAAPAAQTAATARPTARPRPRPGALAGPPAASAVAPAASAVAPGAVPVIVTRAVPPAKPAPPPPLVEAIRVAIAAGPVAAPLPGSIEDLQRSLAAAPAGPTAAPVRPAPSTAVSRPRPRPPVPPPAGTRRE